MEGRKVHDLRGPWNLFSLSTQQALLSFVFSLFFSQRSHLCHQWACQSITNKVSDPTPGISICAEGGEGHRSIAAELPSMTSWAPVEVGKGVGSGVSTLRPKAAIYWLCDFRHIIKLPEITSSSVKQGKTHLLHRVLLRILR